MNEPFDNIIKPIDEHEVRRANARAKKRVREQEYYQNVIKNRRENDTDIVKEKKLAWQREYHFRVTKNRTGDSLEKRKDINRKAVKKWIKKNPEKQKRMMRDWWLKKRYGISIEQFDDMLRRQGFACAICGSGSSGSKNDWHVDHCHATGKIRGILCHFCNVGLGGFRDNAKIMKAAIKYIRGGGFAI